MPKSEQLLAIDKGVQDLLFLDARTAQEFSDEPITDEQVQAIYDLIKWGPTSMNMQPLRIVLIRSDDARARLAGYMEGTNSPKVAAAPLTAIAAADTCCHLHFPTVFPIPGAAEKFARDRRREQVAEFNATLQLGYLIVGIRAAGLGVGPMAGYDADAVNADFFPDGRHRVIAVLTIGHPLADTYLPRRPRLEPGEVITAV
jgi:3-hydroxypropanoate dehydrogenase